MAPTLVGGIVQEAGSWLAGLATPQPPFLVATDAAGGVEVGDREELHLTGGETREVKVLAVDTISNPPRAKVRCLKTQEVLTVPVYQEEEVRRPEAEEEVMVSHVQTTVYQDYEDNFHLAHATAVEPRRQQPLKREQVEGSEEKEAIAAVLVGIRDELKATVQDFQEKGAVGALRDAALDACDVVGSVANVAAGTARAFAQGAVSSSAQKQAAPLVMEATTVHPDFMGS